MNELLTMKNTIKKKKEKQNDVKIAYDLEDGLILGTIVLHAPIENVFQSLLSKDITDWWVRPGVFDVKTWEGDVKIGGHWKVSGDIRGQPYELHGTYVTIEEPHKLIHTYGEGNPWGPTTVTYKLKESNKCTQITLRHDGFTSPQACEGNAIGWETCFNALKGKLEVK